MGYYEFSFVIPEASKDALLSRMSAMGCLGSFEKQKSIVVYFPDTHDIVKLRDGVLSCKKYLLDAGLDHRFTFDYLYLAERDWNEPWKKRFVPVDIGERISIVPPWDQRENGRINLIIDPGMAFGTGHHETTRTCLRLIENYSKETRRTSFLDIGTGTGILSIAASKLGYSFVTAVDTDPLAVDAARRNAELNALQNIEIIEGSITEAAGTFDMIVANLMSEVLVAIAPEISLRLDKNGITLLSGMLQGQENSVIEALEHYGLTVSEKINDGRWVSLIVKAKE